MIGMARFVINNATMSIGIRLASSRWHARVTLWLLAVSWLSSLTPSCPAMLDCTQCLGAHRILSPLDICSCILCVEWLSPEDAGFIFSTGVRHTPSWEEWGTLYYLHFSIYSTCVQYYCENGCFLKFWPEIWQRWCLLKEEKGKQECRFSLHIFTLFRLHPGTI